MRFQGGTLFPSVMAIVLLVGIGLVAYARESAPTNNAPPTINDHWHASYGFYACDQQLPDLQGNKEEPLDPEYQKYGVHSHDDGVIHWHPTALASGRRAKLGLFFKVYGIKVSAQELTFPSDQNEGKSYTVEGTKCKDESGKDVDAQVQVIVWESYDNPDVKKKYITDFDNIRIDKDGMAIMVAFAPADAEIPMPASAANLPELGAIDSGGITTTTLAGATTTTVAGATTTTVASTTTGG